MRKERTRFRWWLLLLSCVLLLNACGGGTQKPAGDDGGSGSGRMETESEPTTSGQTPAEPEKPTELTSKITRVGSIVNRVTDGNLRYQAWPTSCIDEQGTVYVLDSLRLTHIDPFGKNVLYKSTDGGDTWSDGVVINDTPLDDRDAGLLYLGNGKMLMTYFCHPTSYYLERETKWQSMIDETERDALLQKWESLTTEERKGGSYVRLSDDYGETWGDPIRVPVSSPHGPTLLANGDLMYVGTISYQNAADNAGGTVYPYGTYAFVSHDGGRTWEYKSRIKFFAGFSDSDFYEPYAVQLASGRILVALRAEGEKFDNKTAVYLTYSDNGGKTWSRTAVVCEGFVGGPAHLVQLPNGAVLMTYGRRVNEPGNACGIRARISYDDGKTWGDEIVLSTPRDPSDSDLGYPTTVILTDGTLLTVFYQHYFTDAYPSVLCTKWELVPKK